MEFHFEGNQDHQVRAIDAVTPLFQGQPRIEAALKFEAGVGFLGSPNKLDLDDAMILENLRLVQRGNALPEDDALRFIEKKVDSAKGPVYVRFPNFSVEMETGTGKTYVYIRTALELNKQYGFRRFIIVVPSVAIKEGVLKTFEMTLHHFRELFDSAPYKFYPYDSSNLTQIRQFSASPNVEFMVMTLDSFNKAMTDEGKGNVIHRPTDRLQGATPVHLVQACRPILILDEPQNMESEKSIEALAALNPLFALRYSATHLNPYSLVYRLSPADAYRQGLVKRIEVASVLKEDDVNQAYVKLLSAGSKKSVVTASLSVFKLMKAGNVKGTEVTVGPGDDLEEKTGLPDYAGFIVEEISPASNMIRFANGVELGLGESLGADKEAIFEAQIRYTVEEHIRKQRRLRDAGIKVLSLFFIDKVANYDAADGVIRKLFDRAFNDMKAKHVDWKDVEAADVQAAYFASTIKRGGGEILEDSSSGESRKDEEAYELIMKDKEKLLSFDSKVAFIFSHSALREGWDNPNVFQICTLNQSASEMKKRQEIGRGVRLCVDQSGQRNRESQVNVLTVIANQSYDQYVRQLQDEITEAYGPGAELPPKPANARNRTTVTLRKSFTLKPEFKELWDRIKTKTRYGVVIDSEKLLHESVEAIDQIQIRKPRVVVTKAQLDVNDESAFEAIQLSSAKTFVDLAGRFPLPNLADVMIHLLENTTPPVRLTRRTLVRLFAMSKNKQAAVDNPFEFASAAVRILKEKVADHLVNGIKYEKINEWYEMTQLEESYETWEDYVVPTASAIYDKVEYDSQTELQFVEDMEKMREVKMYVKLPSWFKVKTPVGEYNPDWAIVWQDHDSHGQPSGKPLLYLVRETKGTTELDKLRPEERRKVICGKKHFGEALGTNYKVVTSANEIPD